MAFLHAHKHATSLLKIKTITNMYKIWPIKIETGILIPISSKLMKINNMPPIVTNFLFQHKRLRDISIDLLLKI